MTIRPLAKRIPTRPIDEPADQVADPDRASRKA